jgi:hypothetical protein
LAGLLRCDKSHAIVETGKGDVRMVLVRLIPV